MNKRQWKKFDLKEAKEAYQRTLASNEKLIKQLQDDLNQRVNYIRNLESQLGQHLSDDWAWCAKCQGFMHPKDGKCPVCSRNLMHGYGS